MREKGVLSANYYPGFTCCLDVLDNMDHITLNLSQKKFSTPPPPHSNFLVRYFVIVERKVINTAKERLGAYFCFIWESWVGAKETVNTESCAMRQTDRAILCVTDVNTTDSWVGLSCPLRSLMGFSGAGAERRSRPQPLCPSRGGFSHRGFWAAPVYAELTLLPKGDTDSTK